ncbi:P54 [Xanthomonas phage phiL7]|uniref:p54 n=1 Tax=Xanthomonas phage phiL7 TaxID=538979 RepID=C4ML54_9CAUD|nr:P54 [Xanthomonas phage phiL7]ACE75794.1 P54 [Xanthomonas phage phiL7]
MWSSWVGAGYRRRVKYLARNRGYRPHVLDDGEPRQASPLRQRAAPPHDESTTET